MRARILENFRHHPIISAVLAALLIPGGFMLVPIIAWWHRQWRKAKPAAGRRKSGTRTDLRLR